MVLPKGSMLGHGTTGETHCSNDGPPRCRNREEALGRDAKGITQTDSASSAAPPLFIRKVNEERVA